MIDVDALTEQAAAELGYDLPEHFMPITRWVAARVEQDVRQQIERDLLAREAVARGNVTRVVFDSAKTRHSSMAEAFKISATVARGGSDAN